MLEHTANPRAADLRAAIAAHHIVLEQMLARLFDEEGLASLRAECLGMEDGLYQSVVRGASDDLAAQEMLSTFEALFDGAMEVHRRASRRG